jgi:hypothetical protein
MNQKLQAINQKSSRKFYSSEQRKAAKLRLFRLESSLNDEQIPYQKDGMNISFLTGTTQNPVVLIYDARTDSWRDVYKATVTYGSRSFFANVKVLNQHFPTSENYGLERPLNTPRIKQMPLPKAPTKKGDFVKKNAIRSFIQWLSLIWKGTK